jgi:hypothetical protein
MFMLSSILLGVIHCKTYVLINLNHNAENKSQSCLEIIYCYSLCLTCFPAY